MSADGAQPAADIPKTDIAEAARFLECLGPGEVWTFQTFDDCKARANRQLAKILHGCIADHADKLQTLQASGAGAFVMVNRGDGKGRSTSNVQSVRAIFIDLDGAPLGPVEQASLQPHVIVESSPGRFHAYWRVTDCPLPKFREMQSRVCARFDGDPTVKDLPRVMRLPGFLHLKDDPFLARTISVCDRPPYKLAELELAFPEVREVHGNRTSAQQSSVRKIGKGRRNDSLLSQGAKWRNAGLSHEGVLTRLRTLNKNKCEPPLDDGEVNAIAESVFRYKSNQCLTFNPAELEKLRIASPNACKVYVAAKLQFMAGNEVVGLTAKDMKDYGFPDARRLASGKRDACIVGLLAVHRAPTYGQRGVKRVCGLFSLPLCAKLP